LLEDEAPRRQRQLESEVRDRRAELGRIEDLQAALTQFAEWSERDERHGRSEPDWGRDEGRSERARAANEFQIADDFKGRALAHSGIRRVGAD